MSQPRSLSAALLLSTAIGLVVFSSQGAAAQATSASQSGSAASGTTTASGAAGTTSGSATGTTSGGAASASGQLELQQIDVSGNSSLNAPYTTPAAVSTVGRNEIQTFGNQRVDDVLRTIPGTFTQQNQQNPGVSVNIRGLEGSGRVNMMIDGVRQDFGFMGHNATNMLYVDPALLAGIDVQRGAVSTAGGAGALAGTANFRTLGVGDIISGGKNWGALGNLTYGTNGQGWAEMLAGAARLSPGAAIAAAISNHPTQNYTNGAGDSVPNTAQNLTSGLAKLEFNPTENQKLNLGAVIYNNRFGANSYYQTVNSNTVTANYGWNPESDLINFALNGYYNQVNMEYDQPITSGSYAGRQIEDTGWGFDTSNTSEFHLGVVDVSSTYGGEWFYNDVKTTTGGVNPDGNSGVGGLFSQTKLTYGMFDFIAGLRYDYYKLDGTGYSTSQGGYYDVNQSEGRFDPKLTLAVNPWKWLQVYGSWGRSFRAPTTFETLLGGSHPGSTTSFTPNPDLSPEYQQGWEVGLNTLYQGILSQDDVAKFKLDYYQMDVEDYITAQCAISGRSYSCYFYNVPGTSVVRGVELEGGYDIGYAFTNFTYTYTNTNLPSQMNGLGMQSYMPDNIASITIGTRLFDEKLEIGGRGNFVSRSYVGDVNSVSGADENGYMPGYSLFDLYATYQVTDNLQLGISGTNILDRDYTPALSQAGNGPGRTVLFTAKAKF